MRGLGLFFGSSKRNDPLKLVDQHPTADYGDAVYCGDVGLDGYTRLRKADPDRSGDQGGYTTGTVGRTYEGPDQSWEQ